MVLSAKPVMYVFIVILSLAAITNCGGSNNDNSLNNAATTQTQGRVGGLWLGRYKSAQSNFTSNVTGIVTEAGEIFWVYPNNGSTSQVTEGRINLNGGIIQNVGLGVSGQITSQAIQGTRYFNDATIITTQLEGTLVEGLQLILKESYQGNPIGVFTLRYDNTYSNNSAITQLVGDYETTNNQGITISHRIANTGHLTGGNSLDCIYDGSVSLINDFYNLYRVNTTITNCDALNGNWTGYATLSGGANNLNSKITFFTRSATAIQTYSLDRN
ncbi:MAG TPA: hypothetical protein ENJ33_03985 [Thiothrix sp.]|nr:hypothetical protein [Thiothrix sp.]